MKDLRKYRAYYITYEDMPDIPQSLIAPNDEMAIERASKGQAIEGSNVLKVETAKGVVLWQATDA